MTIKEKAIYLINKFSAAEYDYNGNELLSWNGAKQCALICVEEILETHRNTGYYIFEYWQEVKQEIENKSYDNRES